MDCSNSQQRRITSWEEEDVHTAWRHVLCHVSRAGVTSKIKNATNRRERREAKQEIAAELRDLFDNDPYQGLGRT